MKKLIALLLMCAMLLSMSACGSEKPDVDTEAKTEVISSESSTNETKEEQPGKQVESEEPKQEPPKEEVKPEAPKEEPKPEPTKEITVDELETKLSEQPVFVSKTNKYVQSSDTKALYPDLLQAIIKNNSDTDIKDIVIGYVGWDANGLPLKIKGNLSITDCSYFEQRKAEGANIVSGATWGETKGLGIDETCPVETFKAIVVSYTDFEGNTWDNPYLNDFLRIYKEKRIKDIK